MGVNRLNIDTTATITLAGTNVMPVLDTAPTASGFSPETGPAATPVLLSDLATFFGANTGPITSPGAITISGTGANPAGTVRYIGGPQSGALSLAYNALTGGNHAFCLAGAIHVSISANTLAVSNAGAAFAISGRTVALTTDAASGAITFNANVGTGTGAVGGYVFKVPVTHGSDSSAQTLTTVLTLGATTAVFATFAGKINCAVSTTAAASINIGNAGTAPTAPADGDMWIESNALKIRLNGATKTVTVS